MSLVETASKLKKRQTSWEQQRLYNIKNPLMGKSAANAYASRVLANGHSSSTYSTGDAATSEYVDSLSSFKRNAAAQAAASARVGAMNNMRNNRQQVPPDGASALNPPRSPRFSDRYHRQSVASANPAAIIPHDADWFENKEQEEVVEESQSVSGYSRASGRSARSGFSGSTWSSRPKSRTSPATEL